MQRRETLIIITLSLALFGCVIFATGCGALSVSPMKVVSIIFEPFGYRGIQVSSQESAVLWAIRLPRVTLGVLVGATLAVSGTILQGLFRNPLAEPGLIGISAGASLAAAFFMVISSNIFVLFDLIEEKFALPFVAFVGAMTCAVLIHRVSVIKGRTSITTMLLAGIAFNAIGFSLLGLLQYIADDQQLRSLTFWMLGSLGGATWDLLVFTAPMMLLTLISAPFLGHSLNLLQLGEAIVA